MWKRWQSIIYEVAVKGKTINNAGRGRELLSMAKQSRLNDTMPEVTLCSLLAYCQIILQPKMLMQELVCVEHMLPIPYRFCCIAYNERFKSLCALWFCVLCKWNGNFLSATVERMHNIPIKYYCLP